jgi:hypothetical protein
MQTKKINKETSELNSTTDQMDLIGIHSVFHPPTAQYTLSSAAHGTFSKMDHTLGHKACLSKYKEAEITPCILSDHNGIKLELNSKRNNRKYSDS